MRASLAVALVPLATGLGAPAWPDAEQVGQLAEAMQLPGIIHIMQLEGVEYGNSVASQLFPEAPRGEWEKRVAAIYDEDEMRQTVLANLTDELEGEDIGAMIDFFTSEPGITIAGLEVEARGALLQDDVEEMAREAAAIAMADETARQQQLERFVAANDLIEANVQGGLNGSLNFMLGLADGGGFPTMSEGEILQQVWESEPQIRQSTREWTYSFLTLAYEPLDDAALDAYIAFSETDPGQALNDGLFAAFDEMYNDMSRELGQAAARFVVGQQL
ncbi:DUF2059 domain-containing protein [Pseudoroseicyclus sp. H15]